MNKLTTDLHRLVDRTDALCDDIRLHIPTGARSDVRSIAWIKQELRNLPGHVEIFDAPGLRWRIISAIIPKILALIDFVLESPIDPIRAKIEDVVHLNLQWYDYLSDLVKTSSPTYAHALS